MLLSPLVLIQFALMIWAIMKIVGRKSTKHLNKNVWLLIVIFVSIIGPIAYFVLEGEE